MPFGNEVVTIVARSDGTTAGALGTYTQVETTIALPGCHHRPLTFRETAELQFDIATEMWRTTIPIGEYSQALLDAVKAIAPDDAIRVGDQEYQVIGGPRPHDDFTNPFKATIISKKQIG
jgi:hypothetical protein